MKDTMVATQPLTWNVKTLKRIVELGRLPFLVGGFLLFCLGALVAAAAGADHTWPRFFFGYAIMLPAHLSLSYGNNYFDVAVDQHNTGTPISGGSHILLQHPELRLFAKRFALFLIVLSIVIAVAFTIVYDYPALFVLFVAFGNLLGWYYAAPPLRLAYRGLGEIATMATYGLLMPGIGYLTFTPGIDALFLIFTVPLFLYGLVFILTVELPDLEGDRRGGKMTFVARNGRRRSLFAIAASAIGASLSFAVLPLLASVETPIDWAVVFAISAVPLAAALFGAAAPSEGRQRAVKVAYGNMGAIIAFLLILDLYLLSVVA
jgi:1,4-dihydroxy-2-naphthoate octaprenyltransferase